MYVDAAPGIQAASVGSRFGECQFNARFDVPPIAMDSAFMYSKSTGAIYTIVYADAIQGILRGCEHAPKLVGKELQFAIQRGPSVAYHGVDCPRADRMRKMS